MGESKEAWNTWGEKMAGKICFKRHKKAGKKNTTFFEKIRLEKI